MSNCTKHYREFPKSWKRRAKKPFLFAFITTTQMYRIKVEPRYYQAQGPPLSTEVSFVKIDPGDWKLPQDNHRVSNSVFKVKRIIEQLEEDQIPGIVYYSRKDLIILCSSDEDKCKSGCDGGFDDDEDEVGDDLEVSALSQTISQSLKKFVEKFQHRNKEDKSELMTEIENLLYDEGNGSANAVQPK